MPQDVIHLCAAGEIIADANTQTGVFLAYQLLDVAKTIVGAGTATGFQTNSSQRK